MGLVQLLKMKEDRAADLKGVPLNAAQYVHLVAEIEKRVRADRARYLGDPDFYKVSVAQLTDDADMARRAAVVDPATPSDTKRAAGPRHLDRIARAFTRSCRHAEPIPAQGIQRDPHAPQLAHELRRGRRDRHAHLCREVVRE